MDYLLQRAIEYRVARVNRLRGEVLATPPVFISRRLRLEVELDLEREDLAELLRARPVRRDSRDPAA